MAENKWYGSLDPTWTLPKLAETTDCRGIEIYVYEDGSEPHIQETSLDDVTLSVWLEKDIPIISEGSEAKLKNGLKFLIATYSYTTDAVLSVTEEAFKSIAEKFDLRENYLEHFCSTQNYASPYVTHRTPKDSPPGLFFKTSFSVVNSFRLSQFYLPETGVTTGVLAVDDTFVSFDAVIDNLKKQARFISQPTLLSILLTEAHLYNLLTTTHTREAEIDGLGTQTGMQSYYIQSKTENDINEVDFAAATATLNRLGTALALDSCLLSGLQILFSKLERWSEKVKPAGLPERDNDGEDEAQAARMIRDKLDFLSDACESLLMDIEYNRSRIQTLIQVIYQYMAQKDARLNISLAETSTAIAKASKADSEVMKVIAIQAKRDSSAMKTIAILGMFFLPGTFVAALFSMPVYSWNNNDNNNEGSPQSFSKYLKAYWAITVPLTFLVFLSWTLSVLLPWRKWVSKGRWKRRFFGPDVNVVDLGLKTGGESLDGEDEDADDDDEEEEGSGKGDGVEVVDVETGSVSSRRTGKTHRTGGTGRASMTGSRREKGEGENKKKVEGSLKNELM